MNADLLLRIPAKRLAAATVARASAPRSYYPSPSLLGRRRAVFGPQHHRYFATASQRRQQQRIEPEHRLYNRRSIFVAVTIASIGALSLCTRRLRDEKLSSLSLAKDSGLFGVDAATSTSAPSSSPKHSTATRLRPKYDLPSLIETVTRAGLVGSTESVKEELHVLRKWHADRGYHGGIIVRDLSRPLFSAKLGRDAHHGEPENNCSADEISRGSMSQRECYYLYYEIHSDGETRQQLFCRGTTLSADVLTCLRMWFAYDEELGCRVHHGFNQHANRIVEDVLPLLVQPRRDSGDGRAVAAANRATVEVCGHSLGGAVAMLVAIKLRKRGHFVTRVTSLAAPRFAATEGGGALRKWLPEETLRVEDDLDAVTYLPPVGVSVGDKLWLTKDGAYMLPQESLSEENGIGDWPESVWLNIRLFETIWNQSNTHRVKSYVKRLEQLLKEMSND